MVKPSEIIGTDKDQVVKYSNLTILWTLRILLGFMALVVVWAGIDAVLFLYNKAAAGVDGFFVDENVFAVLSLFLTVLIAVEVFMNFLFYLREDAIHVPLVLATALTAIARKVIVTDYHTISADLLYGSAALVVALGVSYWLVTKD